VRLGFERPAGIIKVRRSTSALFEIGVKKLALKRILIIKLYHYRIYQS